MATARESTTFTKLYTNKYIGDAREVGSRPVYAEINVTVVSAAAVNDTYSVAKIPANARVCDLFVVGNGNGASAGSGVTVQVGDAGDDDRYGLAADFDAANATLRLNNTAGASYTPTSDTTVILKFGGAAPVVGTTVKGWIKYWPGA